MPVKRLSKVLIASPLVVTVMGAGACVPRNHVDVTVFLKEINQDIAPVGLSCPEWHYERNTTTECFLENSRTRSPVQITITDEGIEFANPSSANLLITTLMR